jgi:hypothetical protein
MASLALTGCSTTPPTETNETTNPPVSKPADPNAPRGYVVVGSSTQSQTETGELLSIGAGDGFDFIHAGAEPKLYITSQANKYACQIQDHMSKSDATAFANGELSAGKEGFLKEETGEAFKVSLMDAVANGESHRFVAPAKGTGLLISCFGDKGASMADEAWEWVALNVKVAAVSAAEEGKIAAPVAK